MTLTATDREWMQHQARMAGFDLAGIVSVAASAAEERFAQWIAAGHAGEMNYLQRTNASGELLRADARRSMPWARSVLVCAVNYQAAIDGELTPLSIDPHDPASGWIARYAWSGRGGKAADYHDILLPQLQQIEAQLQQRFAGCRTRCYVDTGPLLERDLAARAGIGWIGRNTCVLNQQLGSWLLLGVIVTSLDIAPETVAIPAADRCGTCTRCLDACPTQALLGDDANGHRTMDATRCIAYLTIEKKGSVPEELRAPMGRQVFGCDICQDVCPWNRRAPVALESPLTPRAELVNPALSWLASLEGPAFTRVFRGSPVERTRRQTSRRKDFRRNVAIAMGNSAQREFLPQLQIWANGSEPVLAETAAWAIHQLQSAPGK